MLSDILYPRDYVLIVLWSGLHTLTCRCVSLFRMWVEVSFFSNLASVVCI